MTSVKDFELIKDVKMVTPTFEITLYNRVFFSKTPEAILKSFELFQALCPKEEIKFYHTPTMGEHKPVTPKALGQLASWLKPGAKKVDVIEIEFKNGKDYRDAADFKFLVSGAEKGSVAHDSKEANLLAMAFPFAWGESRADELLKLTLDLANMFPTQNGSAGYSLECNPYDEWTSQDHAWATSMKHPGFDIALQQNDRQSVSADGLHGVNWLTLLGRGLLTVAGGKAGLRKKLSKSIEIIEFKDGVLIKAGAKPSVDNVDLYREVYGIVVKPIEKAVKRYSGLNTIRRGEYVHEDWLRRFSKKK